MPLFAGHMAW